VVYILHKLRAAAFPTIQNRRGCRPLRTRPEHESLTVAEIALDVATEVNNAASRRIEELALEAINGGSAEPLTEAYKEDLRQEVLAYAAGRGSA
jgi:hypothetical protein